MSELISEISSLIAQRREAAHAKSARARAFYRNAICARGVKDIAAAEVLAAMDVLGLEIRDLVTDVAAFEMARQLAMQIGAAEQSIGSAKKGVADAEIRLNKILLNRDQAKIENASAALDAATAKVSKVESEFALWRDQLLAVKKAAPRVFSGSEDSVSDLDDANPTGNIATSNSERARADNCVAGEVPMATAAAEHRSRDGITDDLPVADSKSVFQATT